MEDETSKFLNLLIHYGCEKSIRAQFYRYKGQQQQQHSCSRISYDYYYLLKHLRFRPNADRYADLLEQSLSPEEIADLSLELLKVRNSLAHQEYLEDESQQRSVEFTEDFISKNLSFVEKIKAGVEEGQVGNHETYYRIHSFQILISNCLYLDITGHGSCTEEPIRNTAKF